MPVELKEDTSNRPSYANGLRDGQIAMLTSGPYASQIVQRCGIQLFTLGEGEGDHWAKFFEHSKTGNDMRIRVLEDGVTLTIKDNT